MANLLPGRVAGAGMFLLTGGEPVRFDQASMASGPGLLAVRPERISVQATADGTRANEVPGRVREATYLGGSMEYRIGLPSGAELVARQASSQDTAGRRFQAGDAVVAAWTEQASRLVAA